MTLLRAVKYNWRLTLCSLFIGFVIGAFSALYDFQNYKVSTKNTIEALSTRLTLRENELKSYIREYVKPTSSTWSPSPKRKAK